MWTHTKDLKRRGLYPTGHDKKPQVIDKLIEVFKTQQLGIFTRENSVIIHSINILLVKNYYHINSLFKYINIYRISRSNTEGFLDQIAQNFF
ncbi:MAG: hypothetical protein ACMUEM_01245 [Flavobacteriales bacterium AspAUS03]